MISACWRFRFCWSNAIHNINFQTKSFDAEINYHALSYFCFGWYTYFSSLLGTFVLVVTSHSFTVESADPDARSEPSQLKCSTKMSKNYNVNAWGIFCVLYVDVYNKGQKIDLHLKASDHTHDIWPIKGITQRPLERSHIMIVPSSSPDAMYWPSGDIAKDRTMLLWPMKMRTHSPLCTSHNRTVLSHEPVAM